MKYAIHTNSISSIFQDSSEKSKQTSQLLFGELCAIKSERENFYYIENFHDKHCGWVLKSVFLPINEEELDQYKNAPLLRVCMPIVDVFNLRDKTILRLPAGSIIPNYTPESNKFILGDAEYQIHSSFLSYLPYGSLDGILEVALSFRNSPFMFGGKSVLGLDKVGLVQLIFSLCGYNLPHNMQDLLKLGNAVATFDELEKGDLVFITNGEIVGDVLVYLGDHKMIGVYDKVKVVSRDEIDIGALSVIFRRVV